MSSQKLIRKSSKTGRRTDSNTNREMINTRIKIVNNYEEETGKIFSHIDSVAGAIRYVKDTRKIQKTIAPGAQA